MEDGKLLIPGTTHLRCVNDQGEILLLECPEFESPIITILALSEGRFALGLENFGFKIIKNTQGLEFEVEKSLMMDNSIFCAIFQKETKNLFVTDYDGNASFMTISMGSEPAIAPIKEAKSVVVVEEEPAPATQQQPRRRQQLMAETDEEEEIVQKKASTKKSSVVKNNHHEEIEELDIEDAMKDFEKEHIKEEITKTYNVKDSDDEKEDAEINALEKEEHKEDNNDLVKLAKEELRRKEEEAREKVREQALKELEMEEEAKTKSINVLPVPGDKTSPVKRRNKIAEIDEEEEEKMVAANMNDDDDEDDEDDKDIDDGEDIVVQDDPRVNASYLNTSNPKGGQTYTGCPPQRNIASMIVGLCNEPVYLKWNMIGKVIYRPEETETFIDISYQIEGLNQKIISNRENFTMADISYKGALLANTGYQVAEDEYEDEEIQELAKRAKVKFIGQKIEEEWEAILEENENISAITLGSTFSAVSTSKNWIRFYSQEGNEFFTLGISEEVVSLAAHENVLSILYQPSIPFRGSQNLRMKLFDTTTLRLVSDSSVCVSRDSEAEWFGFSTKGIPLVKDTLNKVWMYVNEGIWTPVHSINNRFWMVGATDSDIYGVKLAYGESVPEPYNSAEPRKIPMKLPFQNKNYESMALGNIQRENMRFKQEIWGHMAGTQISGFDYLDYVRSEMPKPEDIKNDSFNRDKQKVNLVRLAAQEDRSEEAVWIAMTIESSRALEACLKLLKTLSKPHIAAKIKIAYSKLGAKHFLGKREPLPVFHDITPQQPNKRESNGMSPMDNSRKAVERNTRSFVGIRKSKNLVDLDEDFSKVETENINSNVSSNERKKSASSISVRPSII